MKNRYSLLTVRFAALAFGLLSLLGCMPVVKGQNSVTGAFEGAVVDGQTGEPVAGARVSMVNMDTQVPTVVMTDSQGHFRQGLLMLTEYRIIISHDGYKTFEVTLSLRAMTWTKVLPLPIRLVRDTVPTPASLPTPEAATRDTSPPTIQISSPQVSRGLGLGVTTSKITVTGRATDASGINEVLVQGTPAELDEAGNFSATVLLKIGENKIAVTAVDIYGNRATEDLTLRRSMPTTRRRRRSYQRLD